MACSTGALAVALAAAAVSAGAPAEVAAAPAVQPDAQARFARGTVVALRGTPHLWVADAQGTLHWVGDTRAAAGREINWGSRVQLTLDQLRRLPLGDPWLSDVGQQRAMFALRPGEGMECADAQPYDSDGLTERT